MAPFPPYILPILAKSLDCAEDDVHAELSGMKKYSPVAYNALVDLAYKLAEQTDAVAKCEDEKAQLKQNVKTLSDAHLTKDADIRNYKAQIAKLEGRETDVLQMKLDLEYERKEFENEKAAYELAYRERRNELEDAYRAKMLLAAETKGSRVVKTGLKKLVKNVKKVADKDVLQSIATCCIVLSNKALKNMEDCFQRGYSIEWLEQFWKDFEQSELAAEFLAPKGEIDTCSYLMVIGKLIHLNVLVDDVPRISGYFPFVGVQPVSMQRYVYKGRKGVDIPSDVSEWIENYLETHTAA